MESIKAFFLRLRQSVQRAWNRLFKRDTGEEEYARYDEDEETGAYELRGRAEALRDDMNMDDETRLFSLEQLKQEQRRKRREQDEPLFTEKVRRRPFILSLLFTTIRFLILGAVLVGFGVLGAGLGVAKAYIETAPTLDRSQLTKSKRSSYLYDKDGVLICSIADVEYRDWVDIQDIPERLQNAFIAVEDIRFEKHSGVDIKRLFSAMLEVLGNSNASGGSTITQQLIKNKILGNERTYRRKIQEAYLALELEKSGITKDEILEAYLNDIHLGESNYGVKTAAKDYYGKELNALTIRECALLAGLTQNPYSYNPRLNKYRREASRWEDTVNRTNKVLDNMYQAGFINLKEYQEALKEDIYILPESEQRQMYDMPYFVEYAIRDVVTHMLNARGLTEADRATVENELRTSGYHIYTTVDRNIQNTVQETLSTWEEYPQLHNPNKNVVTETLGNNEVLQTVQPQASAVVYDYHTGELRAIVGGRDVPTIRKGTNRAYSAYMEVGSSIKPLAVYGPAFDLGASPGTIIGNFEFPIEGWNTETGYPYIGSSDHIGPLSIRQGIVSSLNVMAARTLSERVTSTVGAQYLYQLGANPSKVQENGSGLALGTSGLTTIQMSAAFGAIAAEGEYKEPLSFSKVVDGEGTIILDANAVREKHQVYKASTAYMLVDVLKEAVSRGTGRNARIENMTVAGKTGTNSDYRSVYFAGMTPYYSAAVWIGHDYPSESFLKRGSTGGDYAAPLWQSFMKDIHEGLPDRDIIETPPSSLGLVRKTVCSVSGLLPTEACYVDTDGHIPITDWFTEENAPTQTCNMHAALSICAESGMIATAECPTTSVTSNSVVVITPGSYYDQFSDEALQGGLHNYVRTPLSFEAYVETMSLNSGMTCTLHGGYGGGYGYGYGDNYGGSVGTDAGPVEDLDPNRDYTLAELKNIGAQLRAELRSYVRSTRLPTAYSSALSGHIGRLEGAISSMNKDSVRNYIEEALEDYRIIQREMSSAANLGVYE